MKEEYNHSGLGICGTLTLIFIVLKVLGFINWSWIWVLSPIWISWVFAVVVLFIIYFL